MTSVTTISTLHEIAKFFRYELTYIPGRGFRIDADGFTYFAPSIHSAEMLMYHRAAFGNF